jgi:putative colanic acid biosynthesis UDP-glucose lipid carrier transferase
MQLTAQVCEADGQLDLSEDRYILALALALGLEPQEYGHIVYDSPFRGLTRLVKRIEDLLLGAFFLALCAPVMIAIALAIKLTAPGPVLFRQRRHGEEGIEFDVLKFRSMKVMENGAMVVQAQRNDSRITPVGAFLRRTSLDELPQFLNVIAGNMSIVGPRPHAIAHNELYRTKILEYMRRHKVKPGITGWAQVNGLRGETDTLEKMVARVEHDLHYIRRWSLWLDIKIVFLTVFGRKVRQNAY